MSERKQELKADAIGKNLVKALQQIEEFEDDPIMVLDSAKITCLSLGSKGACDALQALREYYNGEE